MSLDIFNDAFKSLSIFNESLFDTSTLGVNKLSSFLDDDIDDYDVEVIDSDADTAADLEDSYVGKIITNCNVCHSNIFKNKEDIVIDESGIVNGEDICPYCGEQEGFVILGQVAPYGETDEDIETDEETETDTEEDDFSDIDDDSITESLKKCDDDGEEDLDELMDIEIDAKGFGGSGNTVHVGPGSLTASLKKNKGDSLKESPEGDDLASRVLRYLDSIEARGELTEDAGKVAYSDDHKKLKRDLNKNRSSDRMEESMNNVKVETDDSIVTVNSDDDGKVTVTTEPAGTEMPEGDGEMIAPLSDIEMDNLIDGEDSEDSIDMDAEPIMDMEEPADDEIDVDMDEIDEESLDNLGESYLKEVYDNVASYKTTNSYLRDNKIIAEGIISFNSGVKKKTGFILEACSATKRGRVTFSGYNSHLTESKDAYLFEGYVDNKRLVLEKLSYNYKLNENLITGKVSKR